MRTTVLWCCLACFCAVLLVGTKQSSGEVWATQESPFQAKLSETIPTFDASGRSPLLILLQLVYENHLPTGIEYLNAEALRPISLRLEGKSVREVLSALIDQVPGLQVSYCTDHISVYSQQARDDPGNLLNKVIPEFSVVGDDTQNAAADLMCAVSRTVNPRTGCFASIAKGQWGSRAITLSVRNAPAREILDRIVAQNGDAIWTVTLPPEKLTTVPVVDLWHIYPLQTQFENEVKARLTDMFSQGAPPKTNSQR